MPPKQRVAMIRHEERGPETSERSPEDSIRAYLNFLADPAASLDTAEIERLEQLVRASTDPIERLRHAAALDQARTPDGQALLEGFVRDAKTWADAESIPVSAFQRLGVSDDVLRRAGLIRTGRGTTRRRSAGSGGSSSGRRVSVADMQAWALSQPDVFTIKDVTKALGGSLVTANKALQELVNDGSLTNLGQAPDHKGPGRAPARFSVAKRRRTRS